MIVVGCAQCMGAKMPASDLLTSFLETEARIIAEDGCYAVIAIRVEKAILQSFLQRNGQFVAALSDLTPATELPSHLALG
jgi:hypothetical protein